ncbi:exported hypothetical protein [Vibrio nigripulchritudo MADA3029]|uniref:hypothetical protein n=1 Tax=Vibrio nigripulchritudo TaxID=28173 RepID=UPI0003B1FD16|nr:hypothetical protein [Vibrio nigripulchritudo]CCN50205.1 exported hypothetical protein [Vibrio nigripulchritudo MADA3020]CCN53239.1 exported hypothetical protein [Vibrio nigripulchritudo MADA3021]CCN59238.1 exported hypothetical protein [Vibrio nigripulchritudo MADA3029]
MIYTRASIQVILLVLLLTLGYTLSADATETNNDKAMLTTGLSPTVHTEKIETLSTSLVDVQNQLKVLSAQRSSESIELAKAITSLEKQVARVEAELTGIKASGSAEIEKKIENLYEEKSYFSYADFAAIAITCVSVLITVVGIAIALLSFFGFKNIQKTTKTSTEELATKIANDTAENAIEPAVEKQLTKLIDEGKINEHLEEVVDSFIFRSEPNQKTSIDTSINWSELDWEEPSDTEEDDDKDSSPKAANEN